MQTDNKQQIRNALAKVMKRLRGEKSQFIFSSENEIPLSIISTAERGLKDPQLTTLVKLAEAYNLSLSEFVKMIENELPKGFSMLDK